MSIFKKVLEKTKKFFKEKISSIFYNDPMSDEFYEDLEMVLLSSDIGVKATEEILTSLKEQIKENNLKTEEEITSKLKEILANILSYEREEDKYPLVLMIVGVNGVGKTTTIGKLANLYLKEGKSVVIAAADTFRAAASEQLSIWGDRVGVRVIKYQEGADPAAVVFDAVSSAKSKKTDVLIIDTAGRLHNKKNLMDELIKMSKIANREFPEATFKKYIVIDAITGQNAISQVKLFDESIGVDGIILTKLDSSSKGGAVFGVKKELNKNIYYVGLGEQIDDIARFDAKEFVEDIL